MTEKSVSLEELVRKPMGDEHADVLRETLAWFVGELMEAEVAERIGAGRREKNAGRTTHRNGYRKRTRQTRAGEIELAIPLAAGRQLLPQLPRAAQPLGAGARGRRAGGLRERRQYA